jgi:alpha-beta hydrolase superfamily lysophospholipase
MRILLVLFLVLLISCSQPAAPTQQPQLKPITPSNMPSGTATTIDGQTISYQYYAGKPGKPGIILLHMLRRNRADWHTIAEWLQKQGYNVIVPDLRGHGQSTGNWEQFTPQDFNKMVYDVDAVKSVLESRGVTKFTVIGASIGANIALKHASEHPDIGTMILLSPGLEYRGVDVAGTKFNKAFLVVASKDDEYSAQSVQEIIKANPTAKLMMYEDAGHGTNMFSKNNLAPTILEWIQEHVY